MGLWNLLDNFWGPLEDTVNGCLERRDRQIDKEIRDEIELDRIRARDKEQRSKLKRP